MTYPEDLMNRCRICLKTSTEFTNLYCDTEPLEIVNKIALCFQINLTYEDYLPKSICDTCLNELEIAYNFRVKCLTANEQYKKLCETLETNTSAPHTNDLFNYDTASNIQCDLESGEYNYCDLVTSPQNSDTICKICNKILKSKKSLQNHLIRMHEKRSHVGRVSGCGNSRRYHCTSCSYETPHSQTLVNHMRRHNGERPFSCECGKTFTQASSLAAHRKTHTSTSNFTCPHCGKQFKLAFSLKTHLRVHTKGEFQCSICFKNLKTKTSLQFHLKRHYKIYNYNCEDCGSTFVTSAELYNHRLKHTHVKDMVCHICHFATKTKKCLLAHLKRHEGDKAFKCQCCDKEFYTPGDLRRHTRVHTKEKPFSCQMCSQRFTYSTSLNKHMLNVHSVQYKWGDSKWKDTRIKNV